MKSLIPKPYVLAALCFYPLAMVFYWSIAQLTQHSAQSTIWPVEALQGRSNEQAPANTQSAGLGLPAETGAAPAS